MYLKRSVRRGNRGGRIPVQSIYVAEGVMRHLLRSQIALWLCALFLNSPAQAGNLDLHVAPSGADSNTALTEDQSVASFARALTIAKQRFGTEDNVVIHFAAGSYGGATLEVDWFPGGTRKLILDGSARAGRAYFDGGNGASTWLVIRGKRGEASNVVVRDFDVRNYRSAIAFYGDRFDTISWSSGNLVEGNLFENIGQQRPGVKPAFAAITVTNSTDNVFVRNTFRNISNIDKCDGLHAIYLSGGASRNRIAENVFDGGCGDTIKARDRSDDNVIVANEFRNQTGKSIFVDSFCDGAKTAECADKKQECPSWGNQFGGNRIDDVSRGSMKAVTRSVGRIAIPSCPPQRGGREQRIIEPPSR
jgi:hypothetical protein